MAEKLRCLEILKQPYLRIHDRSTDFYGTKTKLYLEDSSIIVCGKENGENFVVVCLQLYCNLTT